MTKLNSTGTALVYSTYLGGTANNYGFGIALDSNGFIYVTGTTDSSDFPVTASAYQSSLVPGAFNGFVSKLSPDGSSLLYSSYLGGSGQDYFYALAVDGSQNAYLTGNTTSTDFPTTANALQNALLSPSGGDAFLARIDTTQSGTNSLVYSTFLGGSSPSGDIGSSVAVDAHRNAYVAGGTCSTDFPVTQQNAFQVTGNGYCIGFLSQIDTAQTGSAGLVYSTYFGGSNFPPGTLFDEGPDSVTLDSSSKVYVAGPALASDFPTTNGGINSTAGKAFVAKFDTTLTASASLIYSVLVGGSGGDVAIAISVDPAGNAYFAGYTFSSDFPVTPDAVESSFLGDSTNFDGFLTIVSPDATQILYSTYLGGSGNELGGDYVQGVALDANLNIYLTGQTSSSDFPVTSGALQTSYQGGQFGGEGFVAELTGIVTTPQISSIFPTSGGIGSAVTITGSAFGSSQGQSTVTFNGVAASISNWSDGNITAMVPGGLSLGAVSVVVTGNSVTSNGVSFTVTNPLFVTPSQLTMVVGQTSPIQVLDANGAVVSNPTWAINMGSIAEIIPPTNPGDPTVLQANAAGSAILSANYGGLTGTARITVLSAGASLPIGSVQWEIPSLGPGRIAKTVQSLRVDDSTPDLYVQDDGAFGGNGAIRALTSDGQQRWVWRPAGTDNSPFIAAADNQGGVVYFATMDNPNQFQSYCYFGRLDENGIETWQYQETNCREDYAIHPDGTIFLVEPDFQSGGADVITALDPSTGQIKFTIPAPGNVFTRGAISISSDGSVYLPFSTDVDVQLMVIQSDGSYSTQQLDSIPGEGLGRAIPDGQGGALVTLSFPPTLYHYSGSGTSKFALSITPPTVFDGFFDDGPMLLGEDGTAYIVGASNPEGAVDTVQAVDGTSGTVKWTASPGGTPQLGTVLADGSLAFEYELGDFSHHLALAAPNGNISPLFANPSNGSDAGPTTGVAPLEFSYWNLGSWNITESDGGLAGRTGSNAFVAASDYGERGGSEKKDHEHRIPRIVNYLPSQIESQAPGPLNVVATANYPCYMDDSVWNPRRTNYAACNKWSATQDKIHGAAQTYRTRSNAIVRQFRADVSDERWEALAFIGHSVVCCSASPQLNFSIGLEFYYPVNPGNTAGDDSSWDVNYTGTPSNLVWECLAPNNFCDPSKPNATPINKLLNFEKDSSKVIGLPNQVGQPWNYINSPVTTAASPGPPHAPLLLIDKIAQQAKILFFGACALQPQIALPSDVPVFVQMWDINDVSYGTQETRPRAIVIPDANSISGFDTNQTDLVYAAVIWTRIIQDLVVGKMTIRQAVDDANSNVTPEWTQQPKFKVLGNPSVRLVK